MKCKTCGRKRKLSGHICPTCGAVTKFPIWLNPFIYFILAMSGARYGHYLFFSVLIVVFFILVVPYVIYNVNIMKEKTTRPMAPRSAKPTAVPVPAHAPAPKPLARYLTTDETFNRELGKIPRHDVSVSDNASVILKPFTAPHFSNVTVKTDYEKLGNFVVLDTETTGFHPPKESICEVTAIRFEEWKPVEMFDTLVNPGKKIPAAASNVNHITDDMVSDAPTFGQIVQDLQQFIGKSTVIGHNLAFDLEFLSAGGLDLSGKRKYYDTLDLARKTLSSPESKQYDVASGSYDYVENYDVDNYKLQTLCEYYGIRGDSTAHRSASDAYATGILFQKVVDNKMEKARGGD